MVSGGRMKRDKLAFLASLRTKIILGTGLVMVIVLGVFMYVDVMLRKSILLEAEEKRAFDVSHTLMKSIEYPMLDGEMDQVQAVLQKVIELEDVSTASISNASGTIVYGGVPDSRGKVSRSETVKEALRTNALAKGLEIIYRGEKILAHAMPIHNEKPCFKCHGSEEKVLGILLVGTAWEPIEESIRAIVNQHITYFLVCLVLVIGSIAILLNYLVIAPVRSLTRATVVMAKGDLSRRVPVKRDDEIGHLGIAFNQMAVNLEKSRDELLQAQATLEKSVAQLQNKTQELEDFTYIVSHDLKEPLRGITSFAQFVLEDYADKLDQKAEGYLATIMKSAERLKKLIDDLLILSRVTRTGVSFQTTKASGIIEEAIEQIKYSIDEKGVEVVVAQDLPSIYCDKSKLVHLFANLLSNAVKFMDKDKPRIEIGCQDTGDYYQFYVKDNGMGIDERYYQKIFGMFQRLHRREDYEGTGAGLHIAQKIIERHHGKIWVESELGVGSTFYFILPKGKETREEGKNETERD
jgi:signal transduction histidine kinase